LAQKLLSGTPGTTTATATTSTTTTLLESQAVCLGDDDNDIEMVLACRKAFIPTITSDSMAAIVQRYPHKVIAMTPIKDNNHSNDDSFSPTTATEAALRAVWNMLQEELS
jgi:hypothetical protein